jgi:hypothetical protein
MDDIKAALAATIKKLHEAVDREDHFTAEAYARIASLLRDLALMHL